MVKDLEQERKRVCGRRLEAMSIGTTMIEKDEREFDELILEFSKLGVFSKPLHIEVAFEVAAQLHHPAAVPTRRQGSISAKKGLAPGKNRSQKKDRSRKKRGRKKG